MSFLELPKDGKHIHELPVSSELVRQGGEEMLDGLLLHGRGVGPDEDGVGQEQVQVAGAVVGDGTTLESLADQLGVLVLLQLGGRHYLDLALGGGADAAGLGAEEAVQEDGREVGAFRGFVKFAEKKKKKNYLIFL